jgi:hypothetical protein
MSKVEDIIQLQLDRIETFVSQAQQYINQVAYLANASYIVNVPTSPGFGVTDYTNNALDLITGQKPTRPATFGDIEVIGPNAPVLDFRDIDQTLIDSVQAKLLTDLANGGYGIEPNDEAGLWQRERDREAQQAMAEVDEVTRQFAEGGFSMPPGAMFAAQSRVLQNAANKMSAVNRDIALRRSELYVQNRQFAITNASNVEGVLVSLHRAVTEHMNVETALYNSQISKYRADTDAQVEIVKSNVAIYSADVQAFGQVVNAIAEAFRLKNMENQLNNSWNVDLMRTKLEETRIQLEGTLGALKIRGAAAQFGAEYFGRLVQAAMNSINAHVGQSKSASYPATNSVEYTGL